MKKFFSLLLSLIMFLTMTGCSSPKEDDTIKILCPTGAPSLSLVSVYENVTKEGKIDFVDGSDQLVA